MEASASFFTNNNCPYHTCHTNWEKEKSDFNCMFCYCPLYPMDVCPGTPEYIENRDGKLIKDCSSCIYPHEPENYDGIMKMLNQINGQGEEETLLNLTVKEVSSEIFQILGKMCGWDQLADCKVQMETAQKILDDNQNNQLSILVRPFSKEHVTNQGLVFHNETYPVQVLERIGKSHVKKGYMVLMRSFQGAETQSGLLEQFFVDGIETALLDVGRTWLKSYFQEKNKGYVMEPFGPGFYGMDMNSIRLFFQEMDSSQVGVALLDNGNMSPVKSIAMIYLVLDEKITLPNKDCISCKGNTGGCRFCRN